MPSLWPVRYRIQTTINHSKYILSNYGVLTEYIYCTILQHMNWQFYEKWNISYTFFKKNILMQIMYNICGTHKVIRTGKTSTTTILNEDQEEELTG